MWPFTTPQGGILDPANPPDGSDPVAGASGLDEAWSPASTDPINDGGPNHDFKYVRTQLTDVGGTPTGFYWVLAPDVETPSSEFFTKQCGDYDPNTLLGNYISGANLLANVIRHESGPSESHHRQYVDAQNDPNNNLGLFAESFVKGQAVTSPTFNDAVSAGLTSRAQTIVNEMKSPEPYPVNYNGSGQYLGNVNFAPNYAQCPGT